MGVLDGDRPLVPKGKSLKSTSVRIRLYDRRGYILLVLERPHDVTLPGGQVFSKPYGWSLPGGRLKRRANGRPRETCGHAIERELKQEAKYEAGRKRIIAKIEDKEKNHDIIIFDGQDPRLCRVTQEEPDIIDVWWFNPRSIFGSAEDPLGVNLCSEKLGENFPVYRRHVNWIQGIFKK